LEGGAGAAVRRFPESAEEGLRVREHDQLLRLVGEPPHLLHGGEGTMLVEARDRVIDHDDLLAAVRIEVERGEECSSVRLACRRA
jgi:hypothetical protein